MTAVQDSSVQPVARSLREGTGGLYSQTWFPVATSADVAPGQVISREVLDGRVAVFRGQNGVASVVSSYCPHMGADLTVGQVVDNCLRCPFHHWQYDQSGKCVRTGSGDPVPRRADLFHYPTAEKYGLIWAFNGEKPLFDIPGFDIPDEELVFHPVKVMDVRCEPWEFMCNTLDFQHIRVVHGVTMAHDDPDEHIEWAQFNVFYDLRGPIRALPLAYRLGIVGSNIFVQQGPLNGRWLGFLYPCTLTRSGHLTSYFIIATTKGDGSEAGDKAAQEYLAWAMGFETDVVMQDVPILSTMRFSPEKLTRSDRALARFLRYLKELPRANPAAAHPR